MARIKPVTNWHHTIVHLVIIIQKWVDGLLQPHKRVLVLCEFGDAKFQHAVGGDGKGTCLSWWKETWISFSMTIYETFNCCKNQID